MRKKIPVILLTTMLLFSACGGNAVEKGQLEQEIESYLEENKALSKVNEELSSKLEDTNKMWIQIKEQHGSLLEENRVLQDNYDKLLSDYDSLKQDYAAYKNKMQEYEQLQADELEARKIAAAKAIAEEEERQRKEEEEEAKKREAEEKKGYNTGITYQQLARTPDDYVGDKIKFTGKVVQVIDGDDEIHIRLAVNGNYDSIILCGYEPDLLEFRILENDQITIYGVSMGLYSYESTMGKTVTIPCAWVDKIDLKSSK